MGARLKFLVQRQLTQPHCLQMQLHPVNVERFALEPGQKASRRVLMNLFPKQSRYTKVVSLSLLLY